MIGPSKEGDIFYPYGITGEGCHMHPDDYMFRVRVSLTDEDYTEQMIGYLRDNKLKPDSEYCSRPHLVSKIESEFGNTL